MSKKIITIENITTLSSLNVNSDFLKKEITGISSFDEAKENCISFCTLTSESKIIEKLESNKLAACIVKEDMNLSETISNTVIIKSKNPHHSFVSIIPLFHEKNIPFSGISDKAEIDPSAKIGKDVSIAAFSVIGRNSIIENNVTIHPNVVVYNDCVIGENSIIHSGAHIRENCSLGKNSLVQNGAVIGSDGFGYIPDPQLGLKQVPQIGKSILKDHVDIGANACVDRGALGDTTIAQGTKIDNLVQVGHNVEIGNHSILCAHAAVGGSTKIGNQVVLGGCVGVADHVEIGNNVRMGGKTVVFYDVKEPGDYLGIPAMPAKQWQRLMVLWTKLPNIIKDMKSLKKLLKK